jgi:acyl-CoA reductase-like NAD-dependent aldehyde dehydrogenase
LSVQTINPATGEALERYPETPPSKIEVILTQAWNGFVALRAMPPAERADVLRSVSHLLTDRRERYAQLISLEMGKPISQAMAEIEKCTWACNHYAEHGESLLASEPTPSTATRSYVRYGPLGPVLAIMPWNYPFWQVIRAAAPILIAGNSIVLKHASNVTGSALELEALFRDAGLPEGSFRAVILGGSAVMPLIDDPRVRAVTLTGSDSVGAKVAARAGRAIKKTVLELGGSDAFVVLADANIEECVSCAVEARFQNTGQSCIAAKRFILEASIASEFAARFREGVAGLRQGDPLDPTVDLGPVARNDLRATLLDQIRRSAQLGAQIIAGGRALTGPGFFLEPTLVAAVTPRMPLFREETFGPVAPMTIAHSPDEAIELANDSSYGLSANIWTQDVGKAERLSREIESGSVFINGMSASDPRLPFGGTKQSGYGRELGRFGIHEFVNVQTIWIGPRQSS